MGVADQHPAFGQAEQFLLRGFRDRAIGGIDDLLVADPTVERGAAIAEDLAIDFRAELLGPEEHDVEMATAGSDIDERVADAALTPGRSVLVEFIDEDDQLVDAHLALLGHLP